MDRRTLAYAGLAVSTLGWASAFVVGKLVLAAMPPLPVAVWRYAAAATVLLPFAIRRRPRERIGRTAAPLTVMVVAGGVLYPWLFLQALVHTSATNTALLIALNPVLTVVFSPLFGERLDRRRAAGVALALLGAVTVITQGYPRRLAALSLNAGDLIAVAAAGSWAAFNLASRAVVARLSASFVNCVVYSAGGIALAALGYRDHPWTALSVATPATLAGILAMALLSSVMAGQLFLFGVRTVGVTRTVVFVYLVPVLTAVLAAAFLGERFHAAQAVGGAAVLAGVYWTTSGRAAVERVADQADERQEAGDVVVA